MPADRPSGKRANDVDKNAPQDKVKLARIDRGPEDFSSVVKTKLQSYTRTGQACDRCKVRKIRCDALPEGCSHCSSQNLPCYVTNRVTGRTERRGYLQELEREKNDTINHIRHLESLLADKGVQVKPWQWSPYPHKTKAESSDHDAQESEPQTQENGWVQKGSVWVKDGEDRNSEPAATTTAIPTRPIDSHLGVFRDSEPVSSIKGTKLSILGTVIDVASFDARNVEDDPLPGQSNFYSKSLESFLQSLTNNNPLPDAPFPAYDTAQKHAEWYFSLVYPFCPVLHKPTFMNLLRRIYHEPSFVPSICEQWIVHMVFATIGYQLGARMDDSEARRQSSLHYHWCLHKFYEITSEHSIASVQALVMLAMHTRGFPKPGCSAMTASFTLNRAIDMNFHHVPKDVQGSGLLEVEIKRRCWWVALTLIVTLYGRLGRPMPIAIEDFDTDFPMAVSDECLTEAGLVEGGRSSHCPFQVGLAAYRLTPLWMDMYSKRYSIRRDRDPRRYEEDVLRLEEGLRSWQDTLPPQLNIDATEVSGPSQVSALYTQAFSCELLLCLRHPSMAMTNDVKVCADNTRISEEASKKLLKYVKTLLGFKCLDTTWYQMSVYAAAMFTTLAAHWQRRMTTTQTEVTSLRAEMDDWLTIISEIGRLMGSGPSDGVTMQLRQTVQRTIAWIEKDMGTEGGNGISEGQAEQPPPPASTEIKSEQTSVEPEPHQVPLANGALMGSSPEVAADHHAVAPGGVQGSAPETFFGQPITVSQGAQYQSLTYQHQPPIGADGSNGHANNVPFDLNGNSAYLYATATAQGPAAASGAGGVANPLIAFTSQATQQQVSDQSHYLGSNPWHDWAAAMAEQDRYSANVLLDLGASTAGHQRDLGLGPSATTDGPAASVVSTTAHTAGQWPFLVFGNTTGAHGAA